MSLSEKLTAIREGAKDKIPAAAWATMRKATDDLRASGILNGIIKVGDRLPAFELTSARGALVRSDSLLSGRALVFTVFRGHW